MGAQASNCLPLCVDLPSLDRRRGTHPDLPKVGTGPHAREPADGWSTMSLP